MIGPLHVIQSNVCMPNVSHSVGHTIRFDSIVCLMPIYPHPLVQPTILYSHSRLCVDISKGECCTRLTCAGTRVAMTGMCMLGKLLMARF